jgi:hypothetical protein
LALQILPGVGGSGTVAPILSSTPVATSGTGTQAPPLYQMDFNGLTRSAALGLANPTSLGDLEIVFSQIAAALKEKLGELNDMDIVTRAETLRGNRGLVLAAVSLMASMGAELDANATNIRDKSEVFDKAKTDRDSAATTRDGLASRRSGLESNIRSARESINASNTALNNLGPRITEAVNEMSRLKLPERQARYNELSQLLHSPTGLYAQQSAANTNIVAQNTNIGIWEGDIRSLNNQIGPLNEKIDTLKGVMDGADRSRNESAARIVTLNGQMQSFYTNVTSLMLGANNITQGEIARNAGAVATEGSSFDALLTNLAKALVDLSGAVADNSRVAEIVGTLGGSGLGGSDSQPDRFGQMSAPVARAVAFAGLIGATMSALAEVLRNVTAGLGMQSAGDFAAAGQSRVRVGL